MKRIFIPVILTFFSNLLFGYEIYTVTVTNTFGPCKIYTTHFWSDNDTPDNKKDDKYLGYDTIWDCPPDGNKLYKNFDIENSIFDPFEGLGMTDSDREKNPDFFKKLKIGDYKTKKEKLFKEIEGLSRTKIDISQKTGTVSTTEIK